MVVRELTSEHLFERELRKLYHAELEILDLHAELAAAAATNEVEALFTGHEADTVDQIDRIEQIFPVLEAEPTVEASPIMEGILAEKNEMHSTEAPDHLRDLGVLSTGMMNERFEITVLDHLLLLAEQIEMPHGVRCDLATNREEAKAALSAMEAIVERRRASDDTVDE